jgi:putative holliday junction resolvase
MKILALDYGTKRIGVALSDSTHTLASPHPYIPTEAFAKIKAALEAIIKREDVSLILIGMPRNMDGSYGPSSEMVKTFVEKLKPTLTVPIQYIDERLTTVQASRQLHDAGRNTRQQRERIDSAAATVLLQSYLDSQPLNFPNPVEEPESEP